MIWYYRERKNTKDSTKKLLKLMNEFGKIAKHKINIKKLITFLYTNNKNS